MEEAKDGGGGTSSALFGKPKPTQIVETCSPESSTTDPGIGHVRGQWNGFQVQTCFGKKNSHRLKKPALNCYGITIAILIAQDSEKSKSTQTAATSRFVQNTFLSKKS